MNRTLIAIALFIFLPAIAIAHGMKVNYTITPTALIVTAKYDDDEPIFPGTVRIFNAAGEEIAKAATNEQGVAELPRPKPGSYKLRADDGGAHAKSGTFEIPADESATVSSHDEPPNRWLMIALGLGIIAALSFILKHFRRHPPLP